MEEKILTLKSKQNLQCKICDKCCKYRGDIRLTPINIIQISNFLKISIQEFLDSYTEELKNEAPEIVLKSVGKEKICILNDTKTNKCRIQKIKPVQCVVFPLVPVDITKDLFVNSNSCKNINKNRKITVNKWLNGNHNIYKKNKQISLKWIEFIEEIQPKWNNLLPQKQEKIKEIIFKNYTKIGNHKKQILANIKTARQLLYSN